MTCVCVYMRKVSESKGDFERIYEAGLFCLHSNECRLVLSGIGLVDV